MYNLFSVLPNLMLNILGKINIHKNEKIEIKY